MPKAEGLTPLAKRLALRYTLSRNKRWAALAQLVEQRTENPCVTGSSPVGGIILSSATEKASWILAPFQECVPECDIMWIGHTSSIL